MLFSNTLNRLPNPFATPPRRRSSRRSVNTQPAIEVLEERVMLTAFVVDSNLDTVDANDGQTTLREAINAANAHTDLDTISFNIGVGGPQMIVLASALPRVTDQITIDGSTQPGITIDATGITDNVVLFLDGNADGSTLKDFAIRDSGAIFAVLINGVTGSLIDGLDLSHDGSTAAGVGLGLVNFDNNTVRNVTATNRGVGIQISGANGNLFEQNNVSQAGGIGIEIKGTANANVFRQNDASGSTRGIVYHANGLGNQFLDNNLSGTTFQGLTIRSDTQFVVSGNDFTGSGDGVRLELMDSMTLAPSATFDIDVSTVTGIGLDLDDFTNSTIDGFNLSYAGAGTIGTGLRLINSHDNTVRNVTATNRHIGIHLANVDHNLFEQNNVRQAGNGGIVIQDTANANVFRQNDASGSSRGIVYVANGLGNQLLDNNLSGTISWGLSILDDTQFVVAGNDFTHSGHGVLMGRMNGVTINSTNLNINVSTVTGIGLGLDAVTNSIIDGLDLSSVGGAATGRGLQLNNGFNDNTVRNVVATNRTTGLEVISSDRNLFEGNNISQSGGRGIWVRASASDNVFRQNDASGSNQGIESDTLTGRGNQFLNNDLSGTTNWGLKIWHDTQFVVAGNDFSGSVDGVYLTTMDGLTINSTNLDIDVSEVSRFGLLLHSMPNSTVDGLDLSYVGTGRSGFGLFLSQSDNLTVSNLTVGNRNVGMLLGASSDNALIHCTRLVGNVIGLDVHVQSGATIRDSQIEGNDNGITNVSPNLVLAENNYWGAADGPSNLGSNGDSYTGNVDADPFLASLPDCLVDVQTVNIDVKPNSDTDTDTDTANLAANGVLPVVLYTTADFDASTVVIGSVTFAGAYVTHYTLEDVDGDGDLDLVLHLKIQEMVELAADYRDALAADLADNGVIDDNHQDVTVTLRGRTTNGTLFEGTDTLDAFFAGKQFRALVDSLEQLQNSVGIHDRCLARSTFRSKSDSCCSFRGRLSRAFSKASRNTFSASSIRPFPSRHFYRLALACFTRNSDRPAECPLELELGLIVFDDCLEVGAASSFQRANRLQHFQRESLRVADAAKVSLVGICGGSDRILRDVDPFDPMGYLGMCFDDFAGDLIEYAHLFVSRLLNPRLRFAAGCAFAETEIADFPRQNRIEIVTALHVVQIVSHTAAEPAAAESQQDAGDKRSVLLALISFAGRCDQRLRFHQFRPILQTGADEGRLVEIR